MKKNKWISLIVAGLLIVSTITVFSVKDRNVTSEELKQDLNIVTTSVGDETADAVETDASVKTSEKKAVEVPESELKLDTNFVAGFEGKDPEEVKTEKKAETKEDDFIVTAIGKNLESKKSKSTETFSTLKADVKGSQPEDNDDHNIDTVQESKPGELV